MTTDTRKKILVVEDEKDVLELMLLHLKRENYFPVGVSDGEAALQNLEKTSYDLVILDWMLPGVSGLEICRKIERKTPVLMVTARADTADIVLGLEMGADDYITKPFEIPIFLARTRALIRRTQQASSLEESDRILYKGLMVDFTSHQVFCEQQEVFLTPSEFKLLGALMRNQGRVLSRERLIELVQGLGVAVVDRAIDTHVFGLRKKLGTCGDVIQTIRGVGYRIEN